MSARPSAVARSTAAASTSTADQRRGGRGVARRGEGELAGVPGAEDADRARAVGAARARATRPSRRRRRRAPRRAAGRRAARAQGARSQMYAVPRTSTWAESGSSRVTASSRSGVSVSDASVTTRVAGLRRRPTRAPRPRRRYPARTPPESVAGLCIFPRAATIRGSGRPSPSGSPPPRPGSGGARWSRGRAARPRLRSRSGRHGPEGSSRSAGCGRRARAAPIDPVGADASQRSLARSPPPTPPS